MDKSDSRKKQSPAGTSRRAYSLFGGIINLTQSHTQKSNATSTNATPTTTQDPQGSSNVYTVTVNNKHNLDCNTNQVKPYENIAPIKKKKSDQSPSTVSSLTNSCGMSSGTGSCNNSGPIGPAPRTLSILTALNELAISDEIRPNPTCSTRPLPNPSSSSNRANSNTNSNPSKPNPSHSSCHHPSKRNSHVSSNTHGNTERGGGHYEITTNFPSSSSASLHHSPTSIYYSGSSKGIYSNPAGIPGSNSRLKGYNETSRNPIYSSSNTLPSTLRQANKSLGDHKESLGRKAGVKQRDRSKSRTPDWIWKIFQLTKHGKLEELQQSLVGLDSTLIRHLADAKGNTVLHSAVRGGHVNTLQWLVSVLGPQCTEAALSDHNQVGRTVILTALKKGQLECLQWLVHHTKCGERALVPNEGERSLLHFAATYGDINVVRWLCTELIEKGIAVDIRDAGGMTPLHDAAKSGHIIVCHELILAGADPLSQTELGWRPSDLAIRHRHMECASYFMVAEAAGSLGNQLHSLLLAFNHLRQEHEELRSHFRETLRVGKWLAKERNDVIKHFPSKWTQEATSSLLLGGTNNGTRFSDLEHKLVLAEQAWKKFSQNLDDAGEGMLNGEETLFSNITSQDFLQRLAAVQLRHERNQSLGNSLSGSSDEDQREENSSSDASSSDGDIERVTSSLPLGSGVGANAAAIIHSSNVSPRMEKNTIKTRSKAAPWLLPPNDVFLSQLSPFVGAHGKSLPKLDLLHGAPTSPSLLSPIVTPSSATASPLPASTTDAAGKNEKSLVPLDGEHHGGGQSKRDSTSLDISVLEVIEPGSPASSASSKKKREDGVEPFHVSSRPWLDFSDQTNGMLRSMPKCAMNSPSLGIGGDESGSGGGSGRKSVLVVKTSEASEFPAKDGCSGASSPSRLPPSHRHGDNEGRNVNRMTNQYDEYDLERATYSSPMSSTGGTTHRQKHASESVHAAPDLIRGTHYRNHIESRGKLRSSQGGREGQQSKEYFSQSSNAMDHVEGIYGAISARAHLHRRNSSDHEISALEPSFHNSNVDVEQAGKGDREQEHDGSEQRHAHLSHSSTSKYAIHKSQSTSKSDSERLCMSSDTTCSDNNVAYAGAAAKPPFKGNSTKNNSSKPRTPSPKSYVTKLTVIPVEATIESCFLSMRSTSFVREDHQEQQQGSDQLPLPGENQDELSLGLPCQIPSDSVSSSNTPVMPRFNSSGTVVFPLRKPGWYSTELLNLTTPDSSIAGRLSPTHSETSRTESALAPPPSYVSHASQNSETSKTESARGQASEAGAERDLESPGAEGNYINDGSQCDYSHPQIVEPEQRPPSSSDMEAVGEKGAEDSDSFEMCASGSKKGTDYSSSKKDDDGDNDGNTMKACGMFANQRIHARTCFIRSHLSTRIHKTSAQRLPKGHRGQSKPWYEIEGSDDEGSLLRVAKSRPSHSSRFSTSSSSQSTSTDEEGASSENESERDNKSEHDMDDDDGDSQPQKQQHSNHNCPNFL